LLGKNGEPVPRTEVIVSVLVNGRNGDETQNLMTSKEGTIVVGNLQDISKVSAKVKLKSGVVVR
jgi:hypothetical protein